MCRGPAHVAPAAKGLSRTMTLEMFYTRLTYRCIQTGRRDHRTIVLHYVEKRVHRLSNRSASRAHQFPRRLGGGLSKELSPIRRSGRGRSGGKVSRIRSVPRGEDAIEIFGHGNDACVVGEKTRCCRSREDDIVPVFSRCVRGAAEVRLPSPGNQLLIHEANPAITVDSKAGESGIVHRQQITGPTAPSIE